MSENELGTFNLVDQPWLLVRRLDGDGADLSLLDIFRQAGRLTGLVGEIATQTFALTRLLLAVLHRAVDGPRDDDHWEELWKTPELPIQSIEDYLRRFQHRFDLFHLQTPFFQVSDLQTSKGEFSELSKLIADVPNGNPFFTTRLGSGLASLSPAEAARWVVHCQAFDPSGIKSGAVGDARVKGGRGYPIGTAWAGCLGGVLPEGSTLRETLLINLIAADFQTNAQWRSTDAPVWERKQVGAGEEIASGRAPEGPTDLFTWQSRRMRLALTRGRVTGVLICNGERTTPQNKHTIEPQSAWRRSAPQEKKLGLSHVYMPREHDPDRAVWRGLQSLLPGVAGRTQTHDGAPALAPMVLEWLSHLRGEDLLSRDHPIRVRTLGMIYGSNNSIIDEIIDDVVSVSIDLLRRDRPAMAQIAVECAAAAEASARALGFLAGNLAEAMGGEVEGPKSRTVEMAFADLDLPYREWITSVKAESDLTSAQIQWHQWADRIARQLGSELLSRTAPTAWVGRTVKGRLVTTAHADLWFRAALRKALPMAYLDADSTSAAPAGVG